MCLVYGFEYEYAWRSSSKYLRHRRVLHFSLQKYNLMEFYECFKLRGGISYIFGVPQAERIETQILGFLELRETKPTWCLGNGEGGGLIFGGF